MTPLTATLDSTLCQPTSLSSFARRPSAAADAVMMPSALVRESQPRKSGQISINSRWPKPSRNAAASSMVLQPVTLA
ncbi:hypothetical protein D3C71_2190690 [compost metagenome]